MITIKHHRIENEIVKDIFSLYLELHFNIVMLQKSGSPATTAVVTEGVRKLRSRDSKGT